MLSLRKNGMQFIIHIYSTANEVAVRLLISANDTFPTLQDYGIIDENDMKLGKY